jgi:hypothetical protein
VNRAPPTYRLRRWAGARIMRSGWAEPSRLGRHRPHRNERPGTAPSLRPPPPASHQRPGTAPSLRPPPPASHQRPRTAPSLRPPPPASHQRPRTAPSLRPPPPASRRAAGHRTFAPAATARIATSGRASHLRSGRHRPHRTSGRASHLRSGRHRPHRNERPGIAPSQPASSAGAKLRGLFEQGRRCGVRPRYRRRSSEDCSSRGEGAVSGRDAAEAPRTVRAGVKVRCPAAMPPSQPKMSRARTRASARRSISSVVL